MIGRLGAATPAAQDICKTKEQPILCGIQRGLALLFLQLLLNPDLSPNLPHIALFLDRHPVLILPNVSRGVATFRHAGMPDRCTRRN